MKKSLVLISTVAAATAALVYVIRRNRSTNIAPDVRETVARTHHRTQVFAKAKQQNDGHVM